MISTTIAHRLLKGAQWAGDKVGRHAMITLVDVEHVYFEASVVSSTNAAGTDENAAHLRCSILQETVTAVTSVVLLGPRM